MKTKKIKLRDVETNEVFEIEVPENWSEEKILQAADNEVRIRDQKRKAKEPPPTGAVAQEPPPAVTEEPPPGDKSKIVQQLMQEAEKETGLSGEQMIGGLAGLATGVAEAKGIGPASLIEKMAAGASKAMPPAAQMPPAQMPAAPQVQPTPQMPAAQPVAPPRVLGPSGQPMEGFPRASGPGSATFNYGRVYGLPEIEAGRALGTGKAEGEVWDMLERRRQALNRIQQMGGGFVENPRFGGLMTADQGVGSGPRASFVQEPLSGQTMRQLPPRAPVSTTPPPKGGLDQVTDLLRNMASKGRVAAEAIGGAARAVPYLSYPLAGYSIGSDIADIQKQAREKDPDVVDMLLSGLGAVGTGLSLNPFTAPVGLPLATIPPVIKMGRRKFMQEPKLPDATYEEMVEASRPAFRYSRP